MRIDLTPQVVRDIEEAVDYYRGIDQQLSTRFIDDVDAAIERIVMFPLGSPPVEEFEALRRARMRQFPYGLFYEQTPADHLLIVRVLHSRRDYPDALSN